MFKHLTLVFCAASLSTGCVLTTGDSTDTFTDSTNAPLTTGLTGDTGGTVDEPTSGTTSVIGGTGTGTDTGDVLTSGTTADVPTTDAPTESGTTVNTSASSETDTGGALYGNCGWLADESYYSCDGEPGLKDPDGISPIDCAADLKPDAPCSDKDGPVTSAGCCTPEGTLYFCDILTDSENPVIYEQNCN